jgi:hypothetical protein
MAMLFALFVLAASVRENNTPLLNACGADADIVAKLPAGTALSIRYALAGEDCYKVAAGSVEGFLPASAIAGLEEFDSARRQASWVEVKQVLDSFRSAAAQPSLSISAPKGVVTEAMRLIETNQPGRALDLLTPELQKRRDPSLLALAGVAAWRYDDSRSALEYWRASLALAPNAELENLYRRVERETQGDRSNGKMFGERVVLRYEGALPDATARQMTAALDQEYARISGQLGCNAAERIVAIVQSRDAYHQTVEAAEWNGGQYDGRIRVPLIEGQAMDANVRRVFAHEITHACLSMLGPWPAWVQEGFAQRLSGDTLAAAVRQQLNEMIRAGRLPKLARLGADWSHLDTAHARLAYAYSLAAVEAFYELYGPQGAADLMRAPQRLPSITAEIEKRLAFQSQ